jgi:hypothetical protein
MNNKLTTFIILLLLCAVGFLGIQNYHLAKQNEELSNPMPEVKITPVPKEPQPANPEGASPFDRPNVDPRANDFPPESAKMPALTSIKFDRLVHDFGRINEGEKVKTVFRFTNTGKNPLIISNAQGSCGCTVAIWPQHPVKAGGTDEIVVAFDSHDKHGEVEKTVTVVANTNPASTVLTIKSTIVPRDK